MRTISQLVSIPNKYLSDDKHYGVEIEVEGECLPNPNDHSIYGWRIEEDSSLKTSEAWEYVTTGPDTLVGIRTRLDRLGECFDQLDSTIHDSVRAGVHVHMNVQSWNMKQVMTFAMCYYIVEDILLKYCGSNREGNLFTLRTKDAEFILFKLLEMLKGRNLKVLETDIIRYASLNYLSLFKYGTIEFRGMRSTGNLDDIYKWVEIIDELRHTSQALFQSPVDVVNAMSGDGEENFIRKLFPNNYAIILAGNNSFEISVRQACRRVQMIAFGVDWTALSQPKINVFKEGNGL